MRLRGMIAAGLCALSLAAARPSYAATSLQPPNPSHTLDKRLDGTSDLDLTITHDLFLKPVTETLKAADEVRLERYLWTAVPMGKTVVFPNDRFIPITSIQLSDEEYRRWKNAKPKSARQYLDSVATKAYRAQLPAGLRSSNEMPWRTGYADRLAQGLDRASPFIPYLESIALQYGLDRDIWVLALQESLFTPTAVSSAACEGPFQINRHNARAAGLIIPSGKIGGNTTRVNESIHPILAAEAAFRLLRSYSYHTGGILTGVSAYHTGPGNLAKMRALEQKNGDWRVPQRLNALDAWQQSQLASLDYLDMGDDMADFEDAPGTDAADALSWIVTGGWRHPTNRTGYKVHSAQYVPRFVALMNALDRDALYAKERQIVGMKLVRKGQGECSPRGPFFGEKRSCVDAVQDVREVERYKYPTFQAERFTITYTQPQRLGKETLTGADMARLSGDRDFAQRNPHIPLRARIPQGTDVFVPIGMSERVFASEGRISRVPFITYDHGAISPTPADPVLLPEDYDYARIALERSEGVYQKNDALTVCAVADRLAAVDDASWFRSLQAQSAREDCGLTKAIASSETKRFSREKTPTKSTRVAKAGR